MEEIEIEGYRSIRHAKIPLRGLNVLIGPNGAGKSSLLGALELVSDTAQGKLQLHVARHGGAHALLHFGQKQTQKLRCALRFASSREEDLKHYELTLEPSAGDELLIREESLLFGDGAKDGSLPEKPLRESRFSSFPSWGAELHLPEVFHFNDTGPRSSLRAKHAIDDNRALRPDGSNLAAVLYAIQHREPARYREILETTQLVAPFIRGFSLRPDVTNPKLIQLEWRHSGSDECFNADRLSDGTLRFLCLVTLFLQPERPPLILLDEPELGLHPAALNHIADLLHFVARTTQVIVTTQSVTLLDQLSLEDILVVERKDDASVFRRLDEAELSGWLEEYSLGELWLKNLLGSRR